MQKKLITAVAIAATLLVGCKKDIIPQKENLTTETTTNSTNISARVFGNGNYEGVTTSNGMLVFESANAFERIYKQLEAEVENSSDGINADQAELATLQKFEKVLITLL